MNNDKSSPLLPQQGGQTKLIESVAKAIYEQWADQPGYRPWVDGGNSHMQDTARRIAHTGVGAAVLPQVGGAKPEPTFPEMPPSVFKHQKLGPMWDRLEMQFYAQKHADAMVKLLSAVPAVPAVQGEAKAVARGSHIKISDFHGAGAYARCSYCGRYSDNPDSLNKDNLQCDCGKLHGWSGSFKPPTAESLWSGAAPVAQALPVAADLAPGETMIGRARPYAKELDWATGKWDAEVANRPLVNVNRRTLDDTWRQVIRYFGGDDVSLCGPRHDDLVRGEKE